MRKFLEIEVEERKDLGRSASRSVRRQGLIPGIVYGGKRPPVPISIDPDQIQEILRSESGANTIFLLRLKGRSAKRHVMIREFQKDPVTSRPLHTDFVRILLDEKVEVSVPIQVEGVPEGVRLQDGILDFIVRDVRVSCLPTEIPESLTADVTSLKIGDTLKVSDLPRGDIVQVLTPPEQAVIVISPPIKEKLEEEVVPEAEVQEPEVISKGKAPEGKAPGEEESPGKGNR